MKKRYYLAYGSNLNVHQMMYRCPTARIIGTAVIEMELMNKEFSVPQVFEHIIL